MARHEAHMARFRPLAEPPRVIENPTVERRYTVEMYREAHERNERLRCADCGRPGLMPEPCEWDACPRKAESQ